MKSYQESEICWFCYRHTLDFFSLELDFIKMPKTHQFWTDAFAAELEPGRMIRCEAYKLLNINLLCMNYNQGSELFVIFMWQKCIHTRMCLECTVGTVFYSLYLFLLFAPNDMCDKATKLYYFCWIPWEFLKERDIFSTSIPCWMLLFFPHNKMMTLNFIQWTFFSFLFTFMPFLRPKEKQITKN